ncbi:MAG: Proteasome subunit beta type-2 [Chrysothrix sp. TS-e1954]|nr:MAG: Proteasome subunit beta type-2 [Chrysothrix sp. TS-e1954]
MYAKIVLLGLTGKDFTIIAASKAAMRGPTILKATDDKTRQLSDHTIMAYSGEAGDTGIFHRYLPFLPLSSPDIVLGALPLTQFAHLAVKFAEYIQANVALYTTRNSHTLDPTSIASFTRNELARSLRSRSPYNVNLLLGGISMPSSSHPPHTSPNTTSTTPAPPRPSDATSATPSAQFQPVESDEKPVPKLFWMDYLASMAEVPYAAHGYAQYYCLSLLDKHHHPEMSLEAGLKVLRMCADELRRRMPIDFKGLEVKVCTAKGVERVEVAEDLGVKPA